MAFIADHLNKIARRYFFVGNFIKERQSTLAMPFLPVPI